MVFIYLLIYYGGIFSGGIFSGELFTGGIIYWWDYLLAGLFTGGIVYRRDSSMVEFYWLVKSFPVGLFLCTIVFLSGFYFRRYFDIGDNREIILGFREAILLF